MNPSWDVCNRARLTGCVAGKQQRIALRHQQPALPHDGRARPAAILVSSFSTPALLISVTSVLPQSGATNLCLIVADQQHCGQQGAACVRQDNA